MRDIERRLAAAREAGELDYNQFSNSQRFSRKSTKRVLRPETEPTMQSKEKTTRRETRMAKEMRERKFRELQMQLTKATTGELPPSMSKYAVRCSSVMLLQPAAHIHVYE